MKDAKLNLVILIAFAAIVSCIIMGIVTINISIQMKSVLEANKALSERVADLSDRLTTMAGKQKNVVDEVVVEAVENAKVIDNAYSQLHALSTELHDTKLRLASAKKMITRYRDSEKKAISSYIMRRYTRVPKKLADDIAKQTVKVAKEEDVPVSLLVAIMDQESGFNPMAKSPSGARGLMQVMPFWVKELKIVKHKRELHDVYKGIKAGAIILRDALERTNGNVKKALALYKGPKYTAYVKHILRLAGEFEIYKNSIMRPIKSILETFYVMDASPITARTG